MKIAVATINGGLEDSVSPVFGRCPNFTFVQVNEKEIENFEVKVNKFAQAFGGAGIQAAQFIVNEGAEVVIAGNFGPNAAMVLSQAGVKMIQAQGNVKEVVVKYLNGELAPTTGATAPMYGGRAIGGGGFRGWRHAGFGKGKTLWGGKGRWDLTSIPTQTSAGDDKLTTLEKRMGLLEKEIDEIKKMIKGLKEEKQEQ